ncbi:hypothetical protein [Methanobrevibacter filiformis]|uniref:Uncharacterized protein n=1 Tax=Methanobrevibacter filiformis TaxID=55758 RepID=A0A166CYZ9_9EURY|nr:hypothetical protein [Methanobrevibacter filiformis]KZX17637.1 hypothetical protein MBFIL_00240 [Methanobrevibacter filiformis]
MTDELLKRELKNELYIYEYDRRDLFDKWIETASIEDLERSINLHKIRDLLPKEEDL